VRVGTLAAAAARSNPRRVFYRSQWSNGGWNRLHNFFQIPETEVLELKRANSELNAHPPGFVRVLTAKIFESD
jgi:hypothetical protein